MSEISHQQPILEPIDRSPGTYCEPDAQGRCITCSDEALPVTVLQVDELGWTAVVQVEEQITEIDISLVDEVSVGTVLLVHGGVALGKVETR